MSQRENNPPNKLERVEVYLDDAKSPTQVLRSPPFRVDLDTTDLPDGSHELRIVQVYADGARRERTVPFVTENHPPVEIAGFEPGSVVRGRLGLDLVTPSATQDEAAREGPVGASRPPKGTSTSVWWYPVVAAVAFLAIWLFFVFVPSYTLVVPSAGDEEAAAAGSAPAVDEEVMAAGETLFTETCASCHQADGSGMGEAIPALAGNDALSDTDTVLTSIVENEQHPDAASAYDAEELASVATYVRNAWGNAFGPVSQDDAAALASAPAEAEEEPAEAEAEEPAEADADEAEEAEEPAEEEPAAEAEEEAEPEGQAEGEPPEDQVAQEEAEEESAEAAPAEEEPADAEAPAEDGEAEAADGEDAEPEPEAEADGEDAEAEPDEPAAAAPADQEGDEEDDAEAEEEAEEETEQASAGAGPDMYVTATTSELTSQDGTPLGQAFLATPVTVLDNQDDTATIQLQGWSMEAGPSVIFYEQGRRIQLATLTEEGQEARDILEEAEDDFGTLWQHVQLEATLPQDHLAPDRTQIWNDGEELSNSACGGCHTVHPPEDFTANQWPGTIDSMVPSYVSLADDELQLLTKYLQYNARDME